MYELLMYELNLNFPKNVWTIDVYLLVDMDNPDAAKNISNAWIKPNRTFISYSFSNRHLRCTYKLPKKPQDLMAIVSSQEQKETMQKYDHHPIKK